MDNVHNRYDHISNREAAKWRRNFRDAEKANRELQDEVDGMRDLVTELRMAHVERMLPPGVRPEAL